MTDYCNWHSRNPVWFVLLTLILLPGYRCKSAYARDSEATTGKTDVSITPGEIVSIRIFPNGPQTAVYDGFRSFSMVSAFSKHPQTRRMIYEEPEGLALINGLGAQAYRFPGGSFANKFDPTDEKGIKLMEAQIELCRRTDNPQVILVLNLFDGTIEQAITMIRELQKGGVQIVAVELGNEYHLRKYRDKFPNAKALIKEASRFMAATRIFLPGVPFGIPVCSSRHVFDAEQFGSRAEFFEEWNDELASAVKSGALPVQAVIPHFYKQTDQVAKLSTQEARFNGVMQQLRTDSYEFLDRAVMQYYTGLFGNVELWITEWGLKEKEVYGNTIAEGLHVSSFCMDMIRANALSGNRIKHSCYQKLAGPVCIGAITPLGNKPVAEPCKVFQPGTAWYAFSFLNDFIEGSTLIRSRIEGVDSKDLRIETFRKGQDFFVFFANRTNSTYALNFEGNLTCLSGETPWASNGQTYWSDQGGARPVRLVRGQSGGQIPPFAFGYLKTSWDAVKDLR